jgi:SAM-dependent methyltransferase
MNTAKADLKRRLARIPGARVAWGGTRKVIDWLGFRRDFARYVSLATADNRTVPQWSERYVVLGENTSATGFDRHYVYHSAWAARILARNRPGRHVDFSSSVYFVAIVCAFVPVDHYDHRPPDLRLDNANVGFADLTALPFADNSFPSVSCMHVVEHVGLGRYGDALDPDGDGKAMRELSRVVAPNGRLLFVVPVGRPRICFNAHRIYSYEQIIAAFSGLELVEFRLVPDRPQDGGLIEATPQVVAAQEYGCGCFCFRKPAA